MNYFFKYLIVFPLLFVLIFIPICSFADDENNDEDIDYNSLEVNSSPIVSTVPTINARHAVVLDRTSGTILYGKSENEQCKMASTTKILTAIVVIENYTNLSDIISISSKSAHTGRI